MASASPVPQRAAQGGQATGKADPEPAMPKVITEPAAAVVISPAAGSKFDGLGGLDLTGFTVRGKFFLGIYRLDNIRYSNAAGQDLGNANFPGKYPNQSYFLADVETFVPAFKGLLPFQKKFVGVARFQVIGGVGVVRITIAN